MNIPSDLLYSKDHEWVRLDGSTAIVGITDFAQSELGDVVFVQLPQVGKNVKQGEVLGTIEAVKAVADIFSPLSGEIVAVNEALSDKPELLNQDPYGHGWIARLSVTNLAAERDGLLDASSYAQLTTA